MATTLPKQINYKLVDETAIILEKLYEHFKNKDPNSLSIPQDALNRKDHLEFTAETETTAALKAIEGCLASTIADQRYQVQVKGNGKVIVDLEKTTTFLFQTYLSTLNGLGKLDKEVKVYLKNTDLNAAQSIPYRRFAANMYETRIKREYYHFHGSLDATKTLKMLGFTAHNEKPTKPQDIVRVIGDAVAKLTLDQLEEKNNKNKQAGVKVFTYEDFLKTPHGKAANESLPWTVECVARPDSSESAREPVAWPQSDSKRPLAGIKVIELCRIIASPIIGRILAEYGAQVLKVTSPNLPDVPFFQVDFNMGKHTTDLNLNRDAVPDRAKFEELLLEADVVLDGYRPGAIEKLGYRPKQLEALGRKRGRGYVYLSENCFGHAGEWKDRAGWQQIAHCASGVAWAQGKFMHPTDSDPVVPPFPISDYGTGCMGAIAAMAGLLHQAKYGGSWHGKTSLLQYDLLLQRNGQYDTDIRNLLLDNICTADMQLKDADESAQQFKALKHYSSVDQVSGAALENMKRCFRKFFTNKELFQDWYAEHYRGPDPGAKMTILRAVRPVVVIEGAVVEHQRASRPNGSDEATWNFGEDEKPLN